jgi:hypothetical protein
MFDKAVVNENGKMYIIPYLCFFSSLIFFLLFTPLLSRCPVHQLPKLHWPTALAALSFPAAPCSHAPLALWLASLTLTTWQLYSSNSTTTYAHKWWEGLHRHQQRSCLIESHHVLLSSSCSVPLGRPTHTARWVHIKKMKSGEASIFSSLTLHVLLSSDFSELL